MFIILPRFEKKFSRNNVVVLNAPAWLFHSLGIFNSGSIKEHKAKRVRLVIGRRISKAPYIHIYLYIEDNIFMWCVISEELKLEWYGWTKSKKKKKLWRKGCTLWQNHSPHSVSPLLLAAIAKIHLPIFFFLTAYNLYIFAPTCCVLVANMHGHQIAPITHHAVFAKWNWRDRRYRRVHQMYIYTQTTGWDKCGAVWCGVESPHRPQPDNQTTLSELCTTINGVLF